MAMKSLLILCQLGLVASLGPGDCAFVGIYGSQDDFALVLMEDAAGEVLSLTDESASDGGFKVSKFVSAKKHVSDAKRGTVLKKVDFETDASSLVAPTALTVFTGSAAAPTPLCSINLEAKQGSTAPKLNEEVSLVKLGAIETAQYAGSTSGSKEELLEDISNPGNWLHDASRKLAEFSIASANTTLTMTTVMGANTTMTMTTTMTAPAARTVVSACTELGGDVAALAADPTAAAAPFKAAIASLVPGLSASQIENVVFTVGGGCGTRRLDSSERRLQSGGTVTYDLVFPASLGALGSEAAATQAISTLENVQASAANLQQLLNSALDKASRLLTREFASGSGPEVDSNVFTVRVMRLLKERSAPRTQGARHVLGK